MSRRRNLMFPVVLIGFLLSVGPQSWGASTLVLAGRGNGLFEVVGQALENVRSMDFVLTYDPATLTDLRVSPGSLIFGSMMSPDLSTPGSVRVNISSPKPEGIMGNGSVVMFTFSLTGQGLGKITSFTANLTSTTGTVIPLPQPLILADDKGRFPGEPISGAPNPGQNTPGAITGTQGDGPSVVPSALPEAVELPMAADTSVALPVPVPASRPLVTDGRTTGAARSILSLFKEYTGPKTVPALTSLFSHNPYPGFRQEPPIALSDGTAPVTVYLSSQTPASQSPNFALTGAKLVSMKLKGAEYVLVLIPDAKVFTASVTMLNQGQFTEYPLVVAPSLSSGGVLDEATFAAFLKGHAENRGDLNNDGYSDYLDLYLYTANYLVRNSAATPSATVTHQVGTPTGPGALPAVPVGTVPRNSRAEASTPKP
jgi:hypothetical protein